MSTPARILLAAAALVAACTPSLNYPADGPRYTGPVNVVPPGARDPSRLTVVTFNVRFGVRVDSAIALLGTDPVLRDADVILLQEMDAAGTYAIATALGYRFVYYPGALHPRYGRQFGNAVLSRWPITDDDKLLLPHRGRGRRTRRTATAATLQVGTASVRVYSVHLGTFAEIGPDQRRDQVDVILRDAARFRHVVIGGDLNSHGAGALLRDAGYAWPTEHGPRTAPLGRWDHVFLRGLAAAGDPPAGTVRDNRSASDHLPVWAVVELGARAPVPGPSRP